MKQKNDNDEDGIQSTRMRRVNDEKIRRLWKITSALQGLVAGKHCGGDGGG